MNQLLFVGIDVDDQAFHVSYSTENKAFSGDFSCKPSAAHLAKRLLQLKDQLRLTLKCCYEATYLGFSLHRDLKSLGITCEVIAPSSIPKVPGSSVKTDRLDAMKLCSFYQAGLLKKVHIPSVEDELERDFIRSRKFILEQAQSTKRHIIAFFRKAGLDYRKDADKKNASYWTHEHRRWVISKRDQAESVIFKMNVAHLLRALEELEGQIEIYDKEIERLATTLKYKAKVDALKCYRGIDILSAMILVTEIGDITRFLHPNKLTSYAGMDLREYSSGGKEHRFGISKLGNSQIRTTLVEACQSVQLGTKISAHLARRRKETPQNYIQIANKCADRLYKKSMHLSHRGKPSGKIKVACAREMLGFVWYSLLTVSKEHTLHVNTVS